ncbi:putative membrane protein (DUF2178) [Candidatus Methanophagaceae archaeon]|nr:putative membrane protein (DUF2178) [Methanophagales archaeon]
MEIERYEIFFIAGLAFGLIAVLLDYLFDIPVDILLGFLFCGLVVLFISRYFEGKSKPVTDERYKRIDERAGYTTFWIIMVIMGILLFSNRFGELPATTLFIGIYSFFIYRFYYDKKGFK